jgi:hypothetical protein
VDPKQEFGRKKASRTLHFEPSFLLKNNFICFEIKPDFSFIEVVADRVVKVLGNATFSGSVATQLKQFNFIQ